MFPVYLFPFKLVTYSSYYLLKFILKLILAFLGLVIDCIIFPFRSLKNFLKAVFILGVFVYLAVTGFVTLDYLKNQYGYIGKIFCSFDTREKMVKSVVRVVGGYSEGSGFFVAPNEVLTNFHVVAGEPSPKIIFPDGKFVTPVKITGNRDADLAVLYTQNSYEALVLPLPERVILAESEPLISVGYALGTGLTGNATVSKGRFVDFRKSSKMPVAYVQTDFDIVKGMSGGPLVDQCGEVVGVNTMSLSGSSLFIAADWVRHLLPAFTDQNITKINVDAAKSPEEGVRAFYTYLKARKMEDGFNLLSKEYLKKTDFTEWTNRFMDVLDVDVIKVEKVNKTLDLVFVKFTTKNWVNSEVYYHYYEGTWKTVFEDGFYKMLQSAIAEVNNPGWEWFY